VLLMLPGVVHADGGTVRLSRRVGDCRVTVFTAPTPLRVGPLDVSVLVQDAENRRLLPDAAVVVRLTPEGRSEPILRRTASAEQATNKLLRAAQFDIPEAGSWQIAVELDSPRGSGTVAFPVEVGTATPRWWELWGWIVWPAVPVAVFLLHLVLERKARA
jgi:hypothetical protein